LSNDSSAAKEIEVLSISSQVTYLRVQCAPKSQTGGPSFVNRVQMIIQHVLDIWRASQ